MERRRSRVRTRSFVRRSGYAIGCALLLWGWPGSGLAAYVHPGYHGQVRTEPASPDLVIPPGVRIHPRTGNLVFVHGLLERPLPGVPVQLFLVYNADRASVPGPYGRGWWLSVHARFHEAPDGSLWVAWGDGHVDQLIPVGGGGYAPPATHALWSVARPGGTDLEIRTGGGIRYRFGADGNLRAILDPLGRGVTIAYDAYGRPVTVSHTVGVRYELGYDAATGCLAELREVALGRSFTFVCGGDGELWEIRDPLGAATRFGYGAGTGLLSALTLPARTTATIQWNGGLPQRVAYGTANWNVGFDTASRTTTLQGPDGGSWRFMVDAAGRVTQVTDPFGGRLSVVPDATGRPLTIVDATGRTWRLHYDASGRITGSTDPLGRSDRFYYDDGRFAAFLTRYQAVDGATWRWSFDGRGLPVAATDPAGGVRRTVFAADGRLLAVTDATGRRFRIAWGGPATVTGVSPDGVAWWRYGLDAAGRMVAVTDPTGRTTRIGYDLLDRTVAITGPNGAEERFAFDAAGDLLAYTDPLGNVHRFVYDERGRRIRYEAPDGSVERYLYDAADTVTGYVDPAGGLYTFETDLLGRLRTLRYPDGTTWGYGYDAAGRILARYAPTGGVAARYSYDAAGRLRRIHHPAGTLGYGAFSDIWIDYYYDAAGQVTEVVQREPGWSRTTRLRFAWDALGRLTETVAFVPDFLFGSGNTTAFRVGYRWDAESRLLEKYYPSGYAQGATLANRAVYGYDAAGRLSFERLYARGDGAVYGFAAPVTIERRYLRDAYGAVTAVATYRDGVLATLTRFYMDLAGEVTGVDHGVPHLGAEPYWRVETRYWLDAAGHVTRSSWRFLPNLARLPGWFPSGPITSIVTITYDALGRVVRQEEQRFGSPVSGSLEARFYDAAGNVTGGFVGPYPNPSPFGVTRDALGRPLVYWQAGTVPVRLWYDALGRVTGETLAPYFRRDYYYDARGRLSQIVRVTLGSTSGSPPQVALRWDPFDRLIYVRALQGSWSMDRLMPFGSPTPIEDYLYDTWDSRWELISRHLPGPGPEVPWLPWGGDLARGYPGASLQAPPWGSTWNLVTQAPGCTLGLHGCMVENDLRGYSGYGSTPMPLGYAWPAPLVGTAFDRPWTAKPTEESYDEERYAVLPFVAVPVGGAATGGRRGGTDRPRGYSTTLLVTPDPVASVAPAVVDPCGGGATSSFVPDAPLSSGPAPTLPGNKGSRTSLRGARPHPDARGWWSGVPDASAQTHVFSQFTVASSAVGAYFSTFGSAGKVANGAFGLLGAGMGAYGEWQISRSQGYGYLRSGINSVGGGAVDFFYAPVGVVDALGTLATGKDLGLLSALKAGLIRAPNACFGGWQGIDQFTANMVSGKWGWLPQVLGRFGKAAGEKLYDAYSGVRKVASRIVDKVSDVVQDVKRVYQKKGLFGTLVHYGGKLFGY